MIETILSVLLALQPYAGDRETAEARRDRLATVAAAVDDASARATCSGDYATDECEPIWPGSRREIAGLLLSLGWFESRYAAHVHADRCRVSIGECDHGRAKSPWQLQPGHRLGVEAWRRIGGTSPEATRAAAWAAAEALSRARSKCGSLEGAVGLYATGKRCTWTGSKQRVAFAARLGL